MPSWRLRRCCVCDDAAFYTGCLEARNVLPGLSGNVLHLYAKIASENSEDVSNKGGGKDTLADDRLPFQARRL